MQSRTLLVQNSIFKNEASIADLLELSVKGKQKQAAALIDIKPSLLLETSTIIDYSDRTFTNTALQCAAWARDGYMCEMLLNGFEKLPDGLDHARAQLEKFKQNSTPHGNFYDFSTLINPIQTYIDNCNEWNESQCKEHWRKVVGKAQRNAPAHVVNWYAMPHEKMPHENDVELEFRNWSWFPLEKDKGLGYDNGYLRRFLRADFVAVTKESALKDLDTVKKIQEINLKKINQMEEKLKIVISPKPL